MTFIAINPATGEEVRRVAAIDSAAVRKAVRLAASAFRGWRTTTFTERAERLRTVGRALRSHAVAHARLMAEEMGKPVSAGKAEAEKCAWACEYYAERGEAFLSDEPIATDAANSFVACRPLGPILAIMPWNFPYWQVFRFAAPAVMAGNTVLLKHAPNVPGSAAAIERLFRDAGFPEGIFQNLYVTEKQAAAIIRHPLVRGVTLTGSVRAGQAVAKQAGARVKKTVLELGGSDPYVVLEDADVAAAAETCVASRLINSGQSCIAAKRFVVVEPVRTEFERAVAERMRAARMGDPMDQHTQVGPQARQDLREQLHRQVTDSVAAGARCLLGGQMPAGRGWFYPPTVLTDVKPGMPAYDEEVFGPAAAIIPVRNRHQALRVANDSSFGLGAAVFTRDVTEGERIARDELEAGACFVNTHVRSDPRLPFGGIKDSGYGRELGREGIREFVNVKTVWRA